MLNEDDLKEIIKDNVGQRKNVYHLIRILQIKYNRYMNKRETNIFSISDDEDLVKESDVDDLGKLDVMDNLNSTKVFNDEHTEGDESKNENQTTYESLSISRNKIKNDTTKNSSSINRHLINEDITHNENSRANGDIDEEKLNKNFSRLEFDDENDENLPNFCENCLKKFDYSPYTNYAQNSMDNLQIRCYKGEKRKTLVSLIYLFLTCLWTAFMLTVVS